MAKTGRQSFQFMLRLPDDLRERLRVASEANGRSMTAEIISRLEDTIITESFAESLELAGVKSDLTRKAKEASEVQQRLATIEAKLDRILSIEEHFRAQAENLRGKK